MNRVKSIYIGVYLTYAFVIGVVHLINFINTFDLAWLVSTTIHFIPVGYIIKLYLVDTPRTSLRMQPLTMSLVAFALLAALLMQNSPASYPHFYVYVLITFFGWLLYLNWYSKLSIPDNPILQKGTTFPELTFKDINGDEITTTEFTGKPTIYLFYRGNWCPLCMAQIKELAADYQKLAVKGIQIVLISPQPHGHTKRLAKKHDVPFIYLTDLKGEVAKQLKIYHPSGVPLGLEVLGYASDTVFPTVIITNKEGRIIHVDQTDNYRLRPEPSMFSEVLDAQSSRFFNFENSPLN